MLGRLAGFHGLSPDRAVDLWLPASMTAAVTAGVGTPNFRVMVRLAAGLSELQAQSGLQALLTAIEGPRRPAGTPPARVRLESAEAGYSELRRQFGRPLVVLMAGVGLVLLLACVNIARY